MENYDLINPRMGSLNHVRYSNGNCYPAVAIPHGMNFYSIQTNHLKNEIGSDNWFYSPLDKFFEGVRLTHMPSPRLGDYGKLLIYGQCGELSQSDSYWTSYNNEAAVIEPAYMSLYAERDRYSVELTPTNACAAMRFKFNAEGGINRVVFTTERMEYEFKGGRLYISTKQCSANHKYSDDDPRRICERIIVYTDAAVNMEANGNKVSLATEADEFVIYIATSYISFEQAALNFSREVGGKSFDEIRAAAEAEWK